MCGCVVRVCVCGGGGGAGAVCCEAGATSPPSVFHVLPAPECRAPRPLSSWPPLLQVVSALLDVNTVDFSVAISSLVSISSGSSRTTGLTIAVAATSPTRFVYYYMDTVAVPYVVDGGTYGSSIVVGTYVTYTAVPSRAIPLPPASEVCVRGGGGGGGGGGMVWSLDQRGRGWMVCPLPRGLAPVTRLCLARVVSCRVVCAPAQP
jgi:hypothetical protein